MRNVGPRSHPLVKPVRSMTGRHKGLGMNQIARPSIHMVRAILVGLAAVGLMLGTASGAWAGQPDKFGLSHTGNVMIADCGTFQVWDEYVVNERGSDRYDRDGDIVQTVIHYWGVDRFYSPETGTSFSGRFAQGATIDWVKGIVWTEYQGVQATHGIIARITVPGAGVVHSTSAPSNSTSQPVTFCSRPVPTSSSRATSPGCAPRWHRAPNSTHTLFQRVCPEFG